MPGVSTSTIWASSRFSIPWMRLRVVCGLGETMATFWPTRVLTSVDLPALGRPTIATKPDLNAMDYAIVREGMRMRKDRRVWRYGGGKTYGERFDTENREKRKNTENSGDVATAISRSEPDTERATETRALGSACRRG